MKVVLVGTFGLEPKGTVSMRAIPLGMALAQRGHVVTVIVPPWDNPTDSGKRFRIGGVDVVNVKLPLHVPLFWYIALTYRMLRLIQSLKPDVIHCFKPKGFSGLIADVIWLLKKCKLTKVRLVMDTDDLEGKGGWNDMQSYNPVQRWFFAGQERRGLQQADAVTVASVTLSTLDKEIGVAAESLYYVPNGTNGTAREKFSTKKIEVRTQHGLDSKPVILLYTRFFEFDLRRVVGIIAGILETVPDARLLVVGKGLFGEEKTFAELLGKREIGDRVRLADWVPLESLGSYFSASDVALYPMDDTPLNRTKCPVKLVDLLASGVPVVADRVGQTAEYIQDDVTGYLVDPCRPDTFVEKVVSLLQDEEKRRQFGQQALVRMMTTFNWDVMAMTVEKAYGEN